MQNLEGSFLEMIYKSPTLASVLERSPSLKIPNWYFGAGCLAQTIWNFKTGNPPNQFINDIDWVYFDDLDLSAEGERNIEKQVRDHFADIALKFDVKNQARVHQWYAKKFGYEISPYSCIEDAIRT